MSLDEWVNDELHSVLGMSDRTLSQFMIAIAKKSADANEFLDKLEKTETVDNVSCLRTFAANLFDRMPKLAAKIPKVSAQRVAEEKARQQAQWNNSFQLVASDEDDDGASGTKKTKKMKEHKHKSSRHIRQRSSRAESSGDEDEVGDID